MSELVLTASTALPVLERYGVASGAKADAIGALTRRLVAGDEAAWREFHSAYASRLFRYLLVVTHGREDLARETLQQTFLRSVRHMRAFERETELWSWLTVLARTAVLDEIRRDSRRISFLERWLARVRIEKQQQLGIAEDAEAHLQGLLEAGMAELPPDDRELLEHKYLEGDSVREIAVAENRTEKAVEARLGRARRKLRDFVMARLRHED